MSANACCLLPASSLRAPAYRSTPSSAAGTRRMSNTRTSITFFVPYLLFLPASLDSQYLHLPTFTGANTLPAVAATHLCTCCLPPPHARSALLCFAYAGNRLCRDFAYAPVARQQRLYRAWQPSLSCNMSSRVSVALAAAGGLLCIPWAWRICGVAAFVAISSASHFTCNFLFNSACTQHYLPLPLRGRPCFARHGAVHFLLARVLRLTMWNSSPAWHSCQLANVG